MTTSVSLNLPEGVKIDAPILPGFETILTREALELVAKLHREYDPRRRQLLQARAERARRLDAGERPDFLPETKEIREGSWTIGFLTGTPDRSVAPHLPGDHVSVYVPTTPNPTGGYFLMLPRSRVRELEMTVDEALKYIISMGVVAPRGAISPLPAGTSLPARPADADAAIASRN